MFKLVLEKAEEPEIKLPTSVGLSVEKAREFQKNIYFCFINYAKTFVCITTNWKILREMGIPDHPTCLLKNLYADKEATVRTIHGTMNWFQIGKGVWQGCILSSCLLCRVHNANCQAGWNTAGIKIARRNIINLRYEDDTTLMEESWRN